MKKLTRITIEVLFPALMAAVCTPAYYAFADLRRLLVTDILLLISVVFAVALIPSFIYMVLFEIALWLGLARKQSIVIYSACLGAVIGWGFLMVVGDSELWTRSIPDHLFVAILGGISGVLVALTVCRKEVFGKTTPLGTSRP